MTNEYCKICLTKLLCKSDEYTLGAAYVTKPVSILVLNYFSDKLRTKAGKSVNEFVNIVHPEHNAEITKRIHRCCSVVRNSWGCEEL